MKGAPDGERWEIYTVLQDSPSFWGEDGSQSWDAAAAELNTAPGNAATARHAGAAQRCCGAAPDEQAGAAART